MSFRLSTVFLICPVVWIAKAPDGQAFRMGPIVWVANEVIADKSKHSQVSFYQRHRAQQFYQILGSSFLVATGPVLAAYQTLGLGAFLLGALIATAAFGRLRSLLMLQFTVDAFAASAARCGEQSVPFFAKIRVT
jgi:hypothetical protein